MTQTQTTRRTPEEQGRLFRADLDKLGAPPHVADQMVNKLVQTATEDGRDLLGIARLALLATLLDAPLPFRPTLN